ncbi:hypothetical protein B0H34DRAFT_663596 [Crassisporium funariophilum]|nr:hypothetical protein B0H34DRAFT_663596 [Crassisporium funariophilum]
MLTFQPSSHAAQVNFRRPDVQQRAAACTPQGSVNAIGRKRARDGHDMGAEQDELFPAPLILPGDDLALDPLYPAQSLRSFIRDKDRNTVTETRNVVYIAAPPDVDSQVSFLRSWVRSASDEEKVKAPNVKDVLEYLAAFYHGLPVQLLSTTLKFSAWEDDGPKTSKSKRGKSKVSTPSFIGLQASPTEMIGIRARDTKDGAFGGQLNLDDLLDVAISILPENAYALLLLVDHDLYEDDEDEFVCGRAYGGSRVAVVSTARYCPSLDERHGVEREHAWPASHVASYVEACCSEVSQSSKKYKAKNSRAQQDEAGSSSLHPIIISSNTTLPYSPPLGPLNPPEPLQAALSSHNITTTSRFSIVSLSNLWLYRTCRTASHELGHCFGIDHCVYYACIMQGSATLAEDARQPPYLCPVDLRKLLYSTGSTTRERDERLLKYCDAHEEGGQFEVFAAWLRMRLGMTSLS